MTTTIKIHYDGDVPGLREHRLSVAEFGPALASLLTALRRTASAIITEAVEDPGYGSRGGRLAKDASFVDLQVAHISAGSLNVHLQPTLEPPEGMNMQLFAELPGRAAEEVIRSIDAESKGKLRNHSVRRYLKALPAGLRQQRYTLNVDGDDRYDVVIGEVSLPEEPSPGPYFMKTAAEVTGVGFEPGRVEVRLHTEQAGNVTAAATASQVATAIDLRGRPVEALMVVSPNQYRLLWVRPAGESRSLGEDDYEGLVYGKWSELLERLAK